MFEKYDGDWKKVQKILNLLRPYLPRLLFALPLLGALYLRFVFWENEMVFMYIVTLGIGWASVIFSTFPFTRNSAIFCGSAFIMLVLMSQYSLVFGEGPDNSSYSYLINKKSLEVKEVSCDPMIIRTPKSDEMLICIDIYDFQKHNQKNFTQGLYIDSYEFSGDSKSIDDKFHLSFKIALDKDKFKKDLELAILNSLKATGYKDRVIIEQVVKKHLIKTRNSMDSVHYKAREILRNYYIRDGGSYEDIELEREKLVHDIKHVAGDGPDMLYIKDLSIVKLN